MTPHALVKALIEAGSINDYEQWPDDFESIDAVALVKAMAKLNQSQSEKMNLAVWSDALRSNDLLTKMSQARPLVLGQVFDDAMSLLKINFDFGMLGGDSYAPRILPNGGVLIRNFHRVIAIDERPSAVLKISREHLRLELLKLQDSIAAIEETDSQSLYEFFIIHRLENGDIVQTLTVPEQLSACGQTLIAISNKFSLQGSDVLDQAGIHDVANNSRTGVAFLRVFEDRTFVYGNYRASDDYDTLLESFAYGFYDGLDEPRKDQYTNDYRRLAEHFSSEVDMQWSGLELQQPPKNNPMYHYLWATLCGPQYDSYSSRKSQQCREIQPFFAQSPTQPSTYFEDSPKYWSLYEVLGRHCCVLELNIKVFKTIENIATGVAQIVKEFKSAYKPLGAVKVKALAPKYEWATYFDENDVCEPSSKALKKYIATMQETLQQALEQARIDNTTHAWNFDEETLVDDVLSCHEKPLVFAITIDTPYLDLNQLSDATKVLSQHLDADINLSVPAFGLCQGYSCGDFDTGNVATLLLESE